MFEPDAGLDSRVPDAPMLDVALDVPLDVPTVPTMCSGELGAMDGEPCFCQGAFVLDGDVAYRSSYDLEVYDVSGMTVERTATVPQTRPGSEGALALGEDHLFVGGWGLEIFDVSDRRSPRSVATVDFDGSVTGMVLFGSTLWAAVDEAEVGYLRRWDVSRPTAPRELPEVVLMGSPGSLVAFGDRLVVIEARRFMEEGPDTAALVDGAGRVERRIDLQGDSVLRRRAAIAGELLFVAGTMPQLQIVDLEAGAIRSTLDAEERSSGGLGITVADGLAFVSGWQIQVADVSDPDRPRWIGELNAPNDVHHIERRGESVFIGTGGYLGRIPLDCR